MTSVQLSESMEMYIKALFEYSGSEPATPSRLADRLGVTNVSATEMVHRLSEQGLVTHIPYRGVTLTEKGQEAARDILRRQRLWECFLFDHLKIEWAKIYELACELEHATPPEVTEALAAYLDHPVTCPRGNPIPAVDGSYIPLQGKSLASATVGEQVEVLAVNATATDVLRYLQERQILPGNSLLVVEAAPLHGPLTLHVWPCGDRTQPHQEVVLGMGLSEFVIVKPINES